jgi:hypothetical protein
MSTNEFDRLVAEEDELRSKLKQFLERRTAMEKEMQQLMEELQREGFKGRGGLVDRQGFPMADYSKVVSVREKQHALAGENGFAHSSSHSPPFDRQSHSSIMF